MVFIEQILDLDHAQDEFYYLKMEALWILTIFSSHAEAEEMKLVFKSDFSQLVGPGDACSPKETGMSLNLATCFYQDKSCILEKVDRLLQSLITNKCRDAKMLNMILNFIGNCIQEPSPEIAQKVLEETQVISVLDLFYENRMNIELTTLDYSTWIVNCIV